MFLGVVHRIDRPVSGAVIFAKTGKALTRLNEMIKVREIDKYYWAITEKPLQPEAGTLVGHLVRDGRTNKSRIYPKPVPGSKEARLNYKLLGGSKNYFLVEVELLTGRHHQIRGAAFGRRQSDPGRPEIRRRTVEPGRQHLAPFPPGSNSCIRWPGPDCRANDS